MFEGHGGQIGLVGRPVDDDEDAVGAEGACEVFDKARRRFDVVEGQGDDDEVVEG